MRIRELLQPITEMIPRDPTADQMHPPKDPNQMHMAAGIKPTGEIDDALAAVPPKMPVTELFDRQVPVEQVTKGRYLFQVDDKAFQMDFTGSGKRGAVEVSLMRQDVSGYEVTPFDTLNDFRNPIMVYSTAIGIIQKYLRLYQPEVVFFYGFGPDQQRVYAKMAHHLIDRSPGYEVHQKDGTVAFVRSQQLPLNSANTARNSSAAS